MGEGDRKLGKSQGLDLKEQEAVVIITTVNQWLIFLQAEKGRERAF